ncbi:MAG: CalY family protein [Oscillospiraceae bacterium]|nr:CalY family protein [Oscillospiraceae bacterium]
MRGKKEKKNKKTLLALLILLIAIVVIMGYAISYFSDVITTGSVTATAGTLDLVAGTTTLTRYYTQDGVEGQDSSSTITNLNPGDIIEVSGTVTNAGNKSAYLRELLTITLGNNYAGAIPTVTTGLSWTNAVDVFTIYAATATNSDIRDGVAVPIATGVSSTNTVLTFTPTTTTIINGSGTGAESETGGIDSYSSGYKIYFNPAADNEYQQVAVSITDKIEAMQYRNNPSQSWADLTSTEFSLN